MRFGEILSACERELTLSAIVSKMLFGLAPDRHLESLPRKDDFAFTDVIESNDRCIEPPPSMDGAKRIVVRTFSLGKRPSIENREHSDSRHLAQALEFTGRTQAVFFRTRMEYKWSTRGGRSARRLVEFKRSSPITAAALFAPAVCAKSCELFCDGVYETAPLAVCR